MWSNFVLCQVSVQTGRVLSGIRLSAEGKAGHRGRLCRPRVGYSVVAGKRTNNLPLASPWRRDKLLAVPQGPVPILSR